MSRLRTLLATAQPFPGAYLEKTQMEHESRVRREFAKRTAADDGQLAKCTIFGQRSWGNSTISVVTPQRCQQIAVLMAQLQPRTIVGEVPAGEMPSDRWTGSLTHEMEQLFACCQTAGALAHFVVLGST